MPKQKKRYICQECGYQALKWSGQCSNCQSWNTLEEKIINPKEEKKEERVTTSGEAKKISQIKTRVEDRLKTGFGELDRVLGGGIVPGSLILLGGDPGIGKSTLLLQAAYSLSEEYDKVLYITGEESTRQVRLRANRLETIGSSLYILAETNILTVTNSVQELEPDLVVIDSIQTVHNPNLDSAPGSVSQVREATNRLRKLGKGQGIPIFVVGHVTKQGTIAGPKVLEHMVDTVLYFEGDQHRNYRLLRAVKNRFGSTNEVGIFEMKQSGLVEVLNPSQAFISERPTDVSGSVIIPCLEGSRPILIELQALVSSANFGTPSRMTTGIDHKRVSLLLAVLEKRLGLHLQNQDVYINIAGGFQVEEPALDLGVMLAIVSSFRDLSLRDNLAVVGEVGLSGEIRAINQIKKRITEANKLGFSEFIIPDSNAQNLSSSVEGVTINGASNVEEALDLIL
ncbi:DNA repair protein RadA [Halanaerobaculum tunisiense]